MVARFRIVAIDFHTPYKGNNFRNNTNESVNLESPLEHISSLVLMQQNFTVTIQEHFGTDSMYTFNLSTTIIEQCAYIQQLNKYNSHHVHCLFTELTTILTNSSLL